MKRFLPVLTLSLMLLPSACNSRPRRALIGVGLAPNSRAGADLAVKEINANGGVGGVPIELIGPDLNQINEFYKPESILKWAHQFAETKDLLAVIGHSDSASTLSAAATYNKSNIPHLVTIATHPAITNIGGWTYRLCISDSAQGPALAEYAVNDWGKKRIAIIYVNDDYGRALDQLFEKRCRESGAVIVASIMHRNILEKDDEELIRSSLAHMKKSDLPDLIVLFQRVNAAGWTVRAIREAGLKADILGGDNLAQYAFPARFPELTDGIRVSQFLNLDSGDPRAMKFSRDFRAFAGADPDYAQSIAYDAVYLLRDAILAGGYRRAGAKAYLDGLIRLKARVHAVGGDFMLGFDHDARRPLYIAEIRGLQFHVLKSLPIK